MGALASVDVVDGSDAAAGEVVVSVGVVSVDVVSVGVDEVVLGSELAAGVVDDVVFVSVHVAGGAVVVTAGVVAVAVDWVGRTVAAVCVWVRPGAAVLVFDLVPGFVSAVNVCLVSGCLEALCWAVAVVVVALASCG